MKKIIILCIAALACLAFASCGKQDTSGDVMAVYNAANKLIEAGDYAAAEKMINDAAAKYGDGAMLDSLRRKMAPSDEPQAEAPQADESTSRTADDVIEPVTEPYTDTLDDYYDDGLYPNDIFLDGEDASSVFTTVATGASAQHSTMRAAAKTTAAQTTRRAAARTTRPRTTRPATTRQQTTQPVTTTAASTAHNTAQDRAAALARTYLEQSSDSRSQLIARITENGFSEAEAAYAADHCGADWNNQAFKAAKKYAADGSASGGYSAKGMKKQLLNDGFTESEASYAVDHASVDWSAQAVKTAKAYLQLRKSATDNAGGFSYDSLVRQLEKAGFTHDQAVYGASRCGADWNEQALLSAKALLRGDPEMTDKALIEQLTEGELFGGFTPEQARYAVAHCR